MDDKEYLKRRSKNNFMGQAQKGQKVDQVDKWTRKKACPNLVPRPKTIHAKGLNLFWDKWTRIIYKYRDIGIREVMHLYTRTPTHVGEYIGNLVHLSILSQGEKHD